MIKYDAEKLCVFSRDGEKVFSLFTKQRISASAKQRIADRYNADTIVVMTHFAGNYSRYGSFTSGYKFREYVRNINSGKFQYARAYSRTNL